MKSKKILVITDSVSMPRPGVKYEDTWLYLLKQEFPGYDFIDRSARGTTTYRLVTEGGGGVDLLESYNPDIVILQMGITECAPRLFKKPGLEYFIVSKVLPAGLRKKYIEIVKRKRIRNPDIPEVSPKQFKENIISYLKRAEKLSSKVIIIMINPPTDLFIQKSPRIKQNIDLYNIIYLKAAKLFHNTETAAPFENIDINTLSTDELHVNTKGAKIIFETLKPLL